VRNCETALQMGTLSIPLRMRRVPVRPWHIAISPESKTRPK